jgi:uncharacterized protein (DUF952 family)
MRFLYKILKRDSWQDALRDGLFRGSAVDHVDGFIHLSAAHQARETAARHFAGQQDLVLVAFAEGDLENLRWEPSRGGDLFPHVYGPIPTRVSASVHPLPLVDGVHQFPEGLA